MASQLLTGQPVRTMSARTQVWCALSGPMLIVFFGTGFLLAGFIPPPSPNASAQEIADIYRNDTNMIRIGLALTAWASLFIFPWVSVISLHLKRIEGRYYALSYIQLGSGIIGFLLFVFPIFVWQTAAFRPDQRSPETLQLLNDLGCLPFVGIFGPALMQNLVVGIAILQDRREKPVFPRWAGFFNLWLAIGFVPGTLLVFFTDGPFAWDGMFSWWIPLTVFSTWYFVMCSLLIKAIRRAGTEGAGAVGQAELEEEQLQPA